MTLPAEIRNRLYAYVLILDGSPIALDYAGRSHSSDTRMNILRTSKQIRNEALAVYYGNNNFEVKVNRCEDKHVRALSAWLHHVATLCGTEPFASLRFKLYGSPLVMLECMLPLLEVVRETGLRVAIAELRDLRRLRQHERNHINVGSERFTIDPSLGYFRNCDLYEYRLVRQALNIARDARDSAWSKEKLAEEYEHFLNSSLVRGRYHLSVHPSVYEQ